MELNHKARLVIFVVLLCLATTLMMTSVALAGTPLTTKAWLATGIASINSQKPGSTGDQMLHMMNQLTGVEPCVINGAPYDFSDTTFCRWQRGPAWYPGENGITMADKYIEQYYKGLGLNVMVQPWTGVDHTYIPNWGKGDRVDGNSVIAELRGTTKPNEIVLICGHTDSVSWGLWPQYGYVWFNYAPGADDNLSGDAATMIAAKVLSTHRFARTIRFACFGGEEQGLFGSDAYADYCRTRGENIVAVVNCEMIGRDDDGSGLMELHTRQIGNGAPVDSCGNGYGDKAIADMFVNVVDAYDIALNPVILDDNQNYSDHWSFWTKSYNAIAVEEQTLKDNPNYHKSSDTVANLSWPYFTKIVGASTATVAHLAEIQK